MQPERNTLIKCNKCASLWHTTLYNTLQCISSYNICAFGQVSSILGGSHASDPGACISKQSLG